MRAAPSVLALAAAVAVLAAPLAAVAEESGTTGRVDAARKHFDDGEVAREEGKWADAMKAYARAADLDPSRYAAHVRLQEASVRAGDVSGLAERYDRLVAERPDDPAAPLHKLRLSPPAGRLPQLEKAVVARQADADTFREIGRAHLALGHGPQAKKALETAFAQRPADRELLVLSAEALHLSGDAAGAIARLEQALKDDAEAWDAHLALARLHALAGRAKEAVERSDAVLQLRPTHVGAMIVKAEGLSRLGRPDDALKILGRALEVNAADVDARISWADLTARAGTEAALKKAIEAYGKAIAADRTNPRAHYGLGWAHERLGNLADAEKAYRESLLGAPTDVSAVNSLGLVLLRQRKFQEAIVQFKKAVDLDRESPEAYLNLGAAHDEQSQWSEAIDWYTKCLKLKGQDKNVRALLCSAFDHEALIAYPKAEALLLKVKAIRPDDSDIATFLGDNLFFQEKWKVAVKHYQEATRLDAKNRFAWRGLGAALANDRKPEEAVEALEKARALKADDVNVLKLLGDLYYADIEDLEKALAAYEAYVKAGGPDGEVPGRIEEIKKELDERKK
jgi:tetratricopeptide (TPR) repeat protein